MIFLALKGHLPPSPFRFPTLREELSCSRSFRERRGTFVYFSSSLCAGSFPLRWRVLSDIFPFSDLAPDHFLNVLSPVRLSHASLRFERNDGDVDFFLFPEISRFCPFLQPRPFQLVIWHRVTTVVIGLQSHLSLPLLSILNLSLRALGRRMCSSSVVALGSTPPLCFFFFPPTNIYTLLSGFRYQGLPTRPQLSCESTNPETVRTC